MKRACKLALRPGSASRRLLGMCAWARRLMFNAALAWHREERKVDRPVPSEFATATWLRNWRKEAGKEKPDLLRVPSRIFEYAAEDLERGWKAVKARRSGAPNFDRFDPEAGSFAVDGAIVVRDGCIQLPVIGEVRIMPHRRAGAKHGQLPTGRYASARITREHGEWFVSVIREVADPLRAVDIVPTVGLDPGVRKLATLSDGTIYENPRALFQVERRAQRARLSIARKQRAADKKLGVRQKGERRIESKRLKRARRQLSQQHLRATHLRANAIHHATCDIAKKHVVVGVEDTKVRNLTRKRVGKGRAAKAALNRSILDAAVGTLLRVLDYKLRDRRGGGVVRVHAAYSSQDCSCCGAQSDCGSSEVYTCAACGLVLDRDVNAANIILARARVVAAGWSSTEKIAWERGKTRGVPKGTPKARALIREQPRKGAE